MFQRMIDDVKSSTGSAMRQAALTAVAAVCFCVAIAFLIAAGFIAMRDHYGLIEACLATAGLFLLVALIFVGVHAARSREIQRRAAERATSTTSGLLNDPRLIVTGIQVAQAVGVKRLIPLVAIGGLALGLLAARGQTRNQAGKQDPAQ
jgi:hypothetical protein